MDVNAILTGLEKTPWAVAIVEGSNLFPWIESVHILAVVVVVGTIWIVDLRLLGVAAHTRSVSRLVKQMLPITWGAFVVAFMAGFLMFSSKAVVYASNWPFRIKMMMLVCAALNMLYFHAVTSRDIGTWDEGITPRAARFAGGISLSVWVVVIFFGRWIGFTVK